MAAIFHEPEHYLPVEEGYTLLPFRFSRLDSERYVAVNEVGEWQVVKRPDLDSLVRKTLSRNCSLYHELQAKHFLADADSTVTTCQPSVICGFFAITSIGLLR